MEEKIKTVEQISIICFLFATLFIFIGGLIFFSYLEKFFTIDFYVSTAFKILIAIILLYIYIKLLFFMPTKNALTNKQFEELSEKKKKYRIKTKKKENRIPLVSITKFEALLREGDELNKEYYKGIIFFDSFTGFVLFSIFFGFFYMSSPIWTIKQIFVIAKDCIKNKKSGKRCKFIWRKVLDVKERVYVYYVSLLPLPKEKINLKLSAPWEK